MHFLKKLSKVFKPHQIQDNFFGKLIYVKMPRNITSYWEGECFFEPTNRRIELFIDAPSKMQPQNSLQHRFFRDVEIGYQEIMDSVGGILRQEFEQWTRKPMTFTVEKEFSLVSFSIPCLHIDEAEWEMSFESSSDTNHLFTVYLEGKIAKNVTIDG